MSPASGFFDVFWCRDSAAGHRAIEPMADAVGETPVAWSRRPGRGAERGSRMAQRMRCNLVERSLSWIQRPQSVFEPLLVCTSHRCQVLKRQSVYETRNIRGSAPRRRLNRGNPLVPGSGPIEEQRISWRHCLASSGPPSR